MKKSRNQMNTLTLSHTLQEAGLSVKQADAIAQAIDEKNNEIVTKDYFDQGLKGIKEMMYLAFALVGAGIGYLAILIHTVISKL
jgi:hypothetical protein